MSKDLDSIKTAISGGEHRLAQLQGDTDAQLLVSQTAQAATETIAVSGTAVPGCEICVSTSVLLSQPTADSSYQVATDNLISGDSVREDEIVLSGTYNGITGVAAGNQAPRFMVEITNTDGDHYFAPLASIKTFFASTS